MSPDQDALRHRFLCDVMLARLARYLRAAGYDTLLADPRARDAELLRRAAQEGRWLVTLDRQIVEHRQGRGRVCLLPQGTVQEQARRLAAELGLDWLAQPFSRCLVDNGRLIRASPERVAQLPPAVRACASDFQSCPECGRVYWEGSHHRRLLGTLAAWSAAGDAASAAGVRC